MVCLHLLTSDLAYHSEVLSVHVCNPASRMLVVVDSYCRIVSCSWVDLVLLLMLSSFEFSVKKKPVGGVALFGGADLFGSASPPKEVAPKVSFLLQNVGCCRWYHPRDYTEWDWKFSMIDLWWQVPEEKASQPAARPKKTSISLFDDDAEDGGDLFGGSKPVDQQPATKAEVSSLSSPVDTALYLQRSTDWCCICPREKSVHN